MAIKEADVVLCEFYFSDLRRSKKRPVLVFKDNLPFDDFIAIPISSKIEKMQEDEVILSIEDFKEGTIPTMSKLMIRKTFVVSKSAVLKRYGSIIDESFNRYHEIFCSYFNCKKVI